MSYSDKVSEKLSNITVSFKRQRQIIYNTTLDFDTLIEYVWNAFVSYNKEDEITHHSSAREWFNHLNEEFQLKVLGIFEDQVCDDYLDLCEDDEEYDEYSFEELYGDETDGGSSLDKEINYRLTSHLDDKAKDWLERSIGAFRYVKKSDVKQVTVPFSTVEKQLNDLKEENARLKTIIEAMNMALKL